MKFRIIYGLLALILLTKSNGQTAGNISRSDTAAYLADKLVQSPSVREVSYERPTLYIRANSGQGEKEIWVDLRYVADLMAVVTIDKYAPSVSLAKNTALKQSGRINRNVFG